MDDKKQLLLLSNSTQVGEAYLSFAKQPIIDFLNHRTLNICFIPFAAVSFSTEEYVSILVNAFKDHSNLHVLNTSENSYEKMLHSCDVIIVGGGNTFKLLYELRSRALLSLITEKVKLGTPYIGWSAGANIAGLSIKTTNDMPIIDPNGLDALQLVPFQINPHYTSKTIPNHGGESRDDRLNEFLTLNPNTLIAALPEGSGLSIKNKQVRIIGGPYIKIFTFGKPAYEIKNENELQFLIQ